MKTVLIYFALKYEGKWDKIYEALEEKEKVSLKQLQETERTVEESDWDVMTIIDTDYPDQLKEAYKPPFVLFYKGDRKLFKNRFISLTGNQIDQKTESRIEDSLKEINKNNTIVTAAYPGVDREVLIKNTKAMMHILASGFNKDNNINLIRKNDLVISEYPPETSASKDKYRARNRIIAAFASSLVLVTSKKDGPINHLVSSFLNLGKDIFCFPGNGDEQDGNTELIKQGATLITKIRDI